VSRAIVKNSGTWVPTAPPKSTTLKGDREDDLAAVSSAIARGPSQEAIRFPGATIFSAACFALCWRLSGHIVKGIRPGFGPARVSAEKPFFRLFLRHNDKVYQILGGKVRGVCWAEIPQMTSAWVWIIAICSST
jgi:hypothetical protein